MAVLSSENETTVKCGICIKLVRYSGNSTNLCKHIKNHPKENMELQKQREGERNPQDPQPRGRGHWQSPFSMAENIQAGYSVESNKVKLIFITLANSKSINYAKTSM